MTDQFAGEILDLGRRLLQGDAENAGALLSDIGRLTGPDRLPGLVKQMMASLASDPRLISTVDATSMLLCTQGEYSLMYKVYQKSNKYIYLNAHIYLDIVVRAEPERDHVDVYDVEGLDPEMFSLRRNHDGLGLVKRERLPLQPGVTMVKPRLDVLYDLLHGGEIHLLRLVRQSEAPYQLLLDRSTGGVAAALQDNFRGALLETACDLLKHTANTAKPERLRALALDNDPAVAWSAFRTLYAQEDPELDNLARVLKREGPPLIANALKSWSV